MKLGTILTFGIGTGLALFLCCAQAQEGSRDTTFNPIFFGSGNPAPIVQSLIILPDDKIIAAGAFTNINGRLRGRVARFFSDGRLDNTFDPGSGADTGPNFDVFGLAIQDDGKILVGGDFLTFRGLPANRLVRLDYSGERDAAFEIGTGPNGTVMNFAMQPDGKIIVSGLFTNFNGFIRNRIVRLNTDGSVDSSFDVGAGPTPGFVTGTTLLSDGKILVYGNFTNFAGQTRHGLVRLHSDGQLDTNFATLTLLKAPSSTPWISAIATNSDGKILIGGSFTNINGITRSNVARLNADGTHDASFPTMAVGTVNHLIVVPSGKIVIAHSGIQGKLVSRYLSNGQPDVFSLSSSSWQALPFGTPPIVNRVGAQSNDKIIAGGNFYMTFSFTNLIRLTSAPPAQAAANIVRQPVGQSVIEGERPVLMVWAEGYPLNYQWQRNDTNVPGGTSAVLYLPNVTTNQSGDYRVIVSNALNVVTSTPALLTVSETAPFFTAEPVDQTVNAGNSVTFSASVRGLPSLQWFFNGAPLSGATTNLLTLTNLHGTNAGNYWLTASNSLGTATTRTALLSVVEIPPSITTQPTNLAVPYGARAVFSITRSGAPVPQVRWFKDGTNISGATFTSYTINNATTNDVGSYFAVISNYLGSVTSQVAVLTVAQPIELTGGWSTNALVWQSGGRVPWIVQTSVTYDGGDALESGVVTNNNDETFFETWVDGPGALSFWWKVSSYDPWNYLELTTNGVVLTEIAGEVDWSRVEVPLASGTQHLRWKYVRRIASLTGGQEKGWVDQIAFVPITTPIVYSGPSSQSVLQKGYAILTANIGGAGTLHYQWFFNDTNVLAGATNSSLTLTNFTAQDVGLYRLEASNAFGVVSTTNAMVNLSSIVESSALTPLWRRAPGSAPWLPVETTHTNRGLAYNPVNGNVLIISRAQGTEIWALNGRTGVELHKLNLGTNIISGGTFTLNMIGVADDGAVYVGNLTQNSPTDPFRLYRWSDDSSNSLPSLVWQGDPGRDSGSIRWGDSMDVQGSGIQTRVLLGNNTSGFLTPRASVIYPGYGVNSDPLLLALPGGASSGVVWVAFGEGNTFWFRVSFFSLRYVSFADETVTILRTYPSVLPTSSAMAVDSAEQKLGIIALQSPDNIRLYDMPGLTNGLTWLDTEFVSLPFDAPNSFATGSTDFGNGFLYALDSNNGILAFKVAPTLRFARAGNILTLTWNNGHILQSAASLDANFVDVPEVTSPFQVDLSNSETQFFRLKHHE